MVARTDFSRCSAVWQRALIFRGVAQFGSALGSGPRGRGFKSRHLDHKKAKGFALRFFVFADANPRSLPFYRAPGNRSEARFSGRGGAERARGRRPAGAARESSRPRRRGFKSRHLDHEKAKGFLPFAFLYNERPCRRQGRNETKVKKPFTFSVAALPIRRGQERQQECRGRDLSAYR